MNKQLLGEAPADVHRHPVPRVPGVVAPVQLGPATGGVQRYCNGNALRVRRGSFTIWSNPKTLNNLKP